jgi:hypothetical protein
MGRSFASRSLARVVAAPTPAPLVIAELVCDPQDALFETANALLHVAMRRALDATELGLEFRDFGGSCY